MRQGFCPTALKLWSCTAVQSKHPGRQELPADLLRKEQMISCTYSSCRQGPNRCRPLRRPQRLFAYGYCHHTHATSSSSTALPTVGVLYFLVFGTSLELAALFFCFAAAFTCFCTACLCVAFGDLSPMTRSVRSMGTGVNRRLVRFLLRQLLPT